MANKKLSDKSGKKILRTWPQRTKKLWPPPGGKGYWVMGQPRVGERAGPRLATPGASLFHTQPDGLYVHFQGRKSCDVVAVEICGTVQNLNDKRSRYIPASHSIVLTCSAEWLAEEIKVTNGNAPRWKASASFKKAPKNDLSVPVRYLRVLYTLPNAVYDRWIKEHTPTGYEFFCPHSSLDSYKSQKMQTFLRQMSIASQFYTKTH
jgi:hypothetical protein